MEQYGGWDPIGTSPVYDARKKYSYTPLKKKNSLNLLVKKRKGRIIRQIFKRIRCKTTRVTRLTNPRNRKNRLNRRIPISSRSRRGKVPAIRKTSRPHVRNVDGTSRSHRHCHRHRHSFKGLKSARRTATVHLLNREGPSCSPFSCPSVGSRPGLCLRCARPRPPATFPPFRYSPAFSWLYVLSGEAATSNQRNASADTPLSLPPVSILARSLDPHNRTTTTHTHTHRRDTDTHSTHVHVQIRTPGGAYKRPGYIPPGPKALITRARAWVMQTQWQSLREQRNRSQDRGSMPARNLRPFLRTPSFPRKNLLFSKPLPFPLSTRPPFLFLSFYFSFFFLPPFISFFRATSKRATGSSPFLSFSVKKLLTRRFIARDSLLKVPGAAEFCGESEADARWRDEREGLVHGRAEPQGQLERAWKTAAERSPLSECSCRR